MSMHITVDLSEASNILSSISHYINVLPHIVSQPSQQDQLLKDWNLKIQKGVKSYWWDAGYKHFSDINIHHIKQSWGSTSGGWGGMGGAAMTNTYTTVIHCSTLDIIAVYYQGKLAYVKDLNGQPLDLKKIEPYSGIKNYIYKSKR